MLRGPCRYPEHVQKVHRKFSRGLWKTFQPKIWGQVVQTFPILIMRKKCMISPSPQHVFFNIFWLKCYMTPIFFLTQSAKSSAPASDPEYCRKVWKKNSAATWNKSCSSKQEVLSKYSTWLWASFFKISTLSLFPSYNQNGASCGDDFLLTKRTRLNIPPRYLQHYRKFCRKYSGATWKKLHQLRR